MKENIKGRLNFLLSSSNHSPIVLKGWRDVFLTDEIKPSYQVGVLKPFHATFELTINLFITEYLEATGNDFSSEKRFNILGFFETSIKNCNFILEIELFVVLTKDTTENMSEFHHINLFFDGIMHYFKQNSFKK